MTFSTKNFNAVQLQWSYFSNNYNGFNIKLVGSQQTKPKLIKTTNKAKYINITDLDTSKNYNLAVQAFSKNASTNYSDDIEITYWQRHSYSLEKTVVPVHKTINNFAWSKNEYYVTVEGNGIEILGTKLNYKKVATLSSSSKKFYFTSNDKYLIALNLQSHLEVWNTDSWRKKNTIKNPPSKKVDLSYP